jgi:protein subunit release factor A
VWDSPVSPEQGFQVVQILESPHLFMEKNMKRVLELKAGEGGADAKLFATDLAAAYIKFFTRVG